MNYGKIYHRLTEYYGKAPYFLSNGYAFPPLHIFFELTYRCNLRCSMCQFLPLIEDYNSLPYSNEELTTEEIKGIIDQLPRFSLITFTGGEPFLRKDFLDILEYTSRRNKCHIITNGASITEKIAMTLIHKGCDNIFKKGLVLIAVSIEGGEDIHDKIVGKKGSFRKSTEGIRQLVQYRREKKKKYPLINISTVMSAENSGNFSEMVKIADELGVDIISFLTMNPYSFSDRFHEASLEEIRGYTRPAINLDANQLSTLNSQLLTLNSMMGKTRVQIRFSPPGVPVSNIIKFYEGTAVPEDYKCFSPWSKLAITSRGDVVPCINYKFGNLREKTFKEIWNGEEAVRFRKSLKNDNIFPLCFGCCMLEYTGNGQ
ncbi:MAG: radical SAM protein [Nitrospinae bacterium]|nr:radical SAM protein [Nitrospinota bacterium]